MTDRAWRERSDMRAPLQYVADVTPNDGTDLTYPCRAVYVGVGGHVKYTAIDGGTVTLKNLAAGVWHPIAAKRIWTTGTTATDIVAGY